MREVDDYTEEEIEEAGRQWYFDPMTQNLLSELSRMLERERHDLHLKCTGEFSEQTESDLAAIRFSAGKMVTLSLVRDMIETVRGKDERVRDG